MMSTEMPTQSKATYIYMECEGPGPHTCLQKPDTKRVFQQVSGSQVGKIKLAYVGFNRNVIFVCDSERVPIHDV